MAPIDRRLNRRSLLRAGGVATTVALAGCPGAGSGDPTETPTDEGNDRPEPEQQLPTPTGGDPDAAVTVAAFEDFTCPHCATYTGEIQPQIWSEYVEPGDVTYEWHDFPVRQDPHAWLASDAARSVQANADSIDAFWEFTELIFENQNSLSLDTYETLANEVGVDGATVRQETEHRTYEPTVVADRQLGLERNVGGTPTVFVQDERLEGPSLDVLRNAIEEARDSATD